MAALDFLAVNGFFRRNKNDHVRAVICRSLAMHLQQQLLCDAESLHDSWFIAVDCKQSVRASEGRGRISSVIIHRKFSRIRLCPGFPHFHFLSVSNHGQLFEEHIDGRTRKKRHRSFRLLVAWIRLWLPERFGLSNDRIVLQITSYAKRSVILIVIGHMIGVPQIVAEIKSDDGDLGRQRHCLFHQCRILNRSVTTKWHIVNGSMQLFFQDLRPGFSARGIRTPCLWITDGDNICVRSGLFVSKSERVVAGSVGRQPVFKQRIRNAFQWAG